MAFNEEMQKLRVEVRAMTEMVESLSGEAVKDDFIDVFELMKSLSGQMEIMILDHEDGIKAQQVAALETELQVSESAQARLRSELDSLQRTFDTRLEDQVKAETEAIQARLTERMEKQFDSRFIALATEVRRADAEASPCQMEREKRLDEREERLNEKEKRLAEQGAALTVRETSLQETRDDVNRRSRELVAGRQDQLDKVQTLLDTELSAIKSRLESLDKAVAKNRDVRKLQDSLNEQRAALRGLPSKSDVESAVSGLPVLHSLVGAASGLQSAATSQQERLGELLLSQRETLAVLNDAVDAIETKVGLVHEAVEDHNKAVSLQLSAVGGSVGGIGRRLEVEGGLAGQQAVDRLKDDVAGLSRVVRRLPTASHVAILGQDANREIASQEVCQAVSAMSESLAQHLEVLTNWRGTATPDSLQTALGELSETIASIKRQIDGTSEVVDQISSDLGKLGGPTPPSTTEVGKPKWLYRYNRLRFWDTAIDKFLYHLSILNVVGAENMEPVEVSQLLLDTLQRENIQSAIAFACQGRTETWFCFQEVWQNETIEMENGRCPIHDDCILVKRVYFDDEEGEPDCGLKFRKVH